MKQKPGETLDSIIYPDLLIIQKKKGYRFTLDPIMLCGFIGDLIFSPAIDIGSGSGIISLLLTRHRPKLHVVGLELQESLAEMSRRSAVLNKLDGRVSIIRGDMRNCSNIFRPGSFKTVICNPPYRKSGTGRISPVQERAAAMHELFMTLKDLILAIDHLLAPDGVFFLTLKPERLEELSEELSERGLGLVSVRFVRSRPKDDPFLLLCHGSSNTVISKPCELPPLVVYKDHDYTDEIQCLLKKGVLP